MERQSFREVDALAGDMMLSGEVSGQHGVGARRERERIYRLRRRRMGQESPRRAVVNGIEHHAG